MRSLHDNDVFFIIGGDFNKLNITDILNSYGALKQICTEPNRRNATLQLILTDLGHLYHPPTVLPPLQVDHDKHGKDSDHCINILAPKENAQYYVKPQKKIIKFRPMPESKVLEFGRAIANQSWSKLYEPDDLNYKTNYFQSILRNNLDLFIPEKTVTFSSLDKKWFSPQLKYLHRKMQREFYKHRKSKNCGEN